MPRKRLLIVTDEMEVAGSQRQIAHFLCHIDRAEWQAELLYFRRPSFLLDQIAAAGVPVHCIPKTRAIDPAFVWRLVAFLRRGRYDLVHCFSLTAELWVSLAHVFARRAALIVSMRDMGDILSSRQWTIKRALCRNADAIISNSQRAADRLVRELGASRPIDVVPNGITTPQLLDPARRAAVRAALPVARRDAVVALFVGRLAAQKNVALLLDAIASLGKTERPALLLAGSGPLRAQLTAQADSLGIADDVAFLGERDDVGDLMQAVDLLVLPSLDEGLSNVVLEAMASGLAVVASRVGGNPEVIVDGESGLLFDSGDRTALIAHLGTLVTDRARRETIGRAARERVADYYSIDALVARTCAIYRRVLDTKAMR
ncbi:MAG: glycosyltransferase [Proteobacteria bacterium]|uniref:glycosyltransferase n=1 Tax=Rudaea sp. TaxID=2136325 RepID=UPI0032200190|nr:glycosyltransferase [Pseudomonadota bacterium]